MSPVLTIAIPTWNRARYLALTLEQLRLELGSSNSGRIEVLVSDNCSHDDTPQVVAASNLEGPLLRYERNAENIGSDANIAQCFNLARGKYVLILGDDDLLVDGALAALCSYLESEPYGVVCLRPYGYEHDFRREYPGGKGHLREFSDAGDFLAAIGPYMTLISSCAISKDVLADINARTFCGGNLVQVHLVMIAALRAPKNLFVDHYQVACKRNNSGGYDFSKVFVEEFGRILDDAKHLGLTDIAIHKIETRMLVGYYPTYLLRQRHQISGDLAATRARFDSRFGGRVIYQILLAPILSLPRPLAIAWGTLTTLFGRAINGELRRGLAFGWHRITKVMPSR